MPLSINLIICTYERNDLLDKLIDNIQRLENISDFIDVIIVNNSDAKLMLDRKMSNVKLNINNYSEPTRGLSFARNTGLSHSKKEWLIFIDDDTQVPEDFFAKALAIIEGNTFDCFGGMYYPWHPYGPSPRWLASDFGQKQALRSDRGTIIPGGGGFLSAGVLAIKREVLLAVGGFNTSLGMNAQVGYGEEDELQLRLYHAGYKIGFDPDWWLYHAVLPHKYRLSWHLRSIYARARDAQRVLNNYSLPAIISYFLLVTLTALVKRLPIVLFSLITRKNYYWQNALLEFVAPWLEWYGRFIGYFMAA